MQIHDFISTFIIFLVEKTRKKKKKQNYLQVRGIAQLV